MMAAYLLQVVEELVGDYVQPEVSPGLDLPFFADWALELGHLLVFELELEDAEDRHHMVALARVEPSASAAIGYLLPGVLAREVELRFGLSVHVHLEFLKCCNHLHPSLVAVLRRTHEAGDVPLPQVPKLLF